MLKLSYVKVSGKWVKVESYVKVSGKWVKVESYVKVSGKCVKVELCKGEWKVGES